MEKEKLLEYIESGEYAKDLFSDKNMAEVAYLTRHKEIDLGELLIELGFKEYDEKVSLHEDRNLAVIHHWDKMYTKFSKEGKPWGCTVYIRNDFPGFIRIDAAVAPGAVYGHLGIKRFQGQVEERREVLEVLLNQVLQGYYK